MYRALPMRWRVLVKRGAEAHPLRRPFCTEATWRPVQSWDETECDVEIVEEINFKRSDDELLSELGRLGRYTGRHLLTAVGDFGVSFAQSKAYKASRGESVVLAEISDWMKKEIENLFREFVPPS